MKAFLALLALLQSAGVLVNRMSIPAQMALTLMPRRSVDAQFFLALANLIEKACIFHRDYCLGGEIFEQRDLLLREWSDLAAIRDRVVCQRRRAASSSICQSHP